ncbi:hypothetical protein ASPZODRAFT_64562 [Penicilliopsis zonata CBS 506.65]|uniref:Isopenicillin N synthase-like Fe(2+) 2OG dioxygenase domain-containing protein n=1 Tax=Penicilliopsis zonata CBS 506.65 TaxID=1073090 RepID=A0A1L9SK35_9EURO|nr:hypothetical protein ASPZODRAFT_64562 [Penicilliopsis zonata CBS 506.65]OJJ47527.1 hypothetical protein ASPZODRAFT_64562 [Penicilliopsis zonata CBS 506.65]
MLRIAARRRSPWGGHTDIGSVVLPFNIVGGLQILPAGNTNTSENRRYICPEQGCAGINIGDAIVEWMGDVLRSSLHRVVKVIPPAVEGEREETRTVDECILWRTRHFVNGEKLQTRGGGLSELTG